MMHYGRWRRVAVWSASARHFRGNLGEHGRVAGTASNGADELRRRHRRTLGRVHRPACRSRRLSSRHRPTRSSCDVARGCRVERGRQHVRRDYSHPWPSRPTARGARRLRARDRAPIAGHRRRAGGRRRRPKPRRCSTISAARTWPTIKPLLGLAAFADSARLAAARKRSRGDGDRERGARAARSRRGASCRRTARTRSRSARRHCRRHRAKRRSCSRSPQLHREIDASAAGAADSRARNDGVGARGGQRRHGAHRRGARRGRRREYAAADNSRRRCGTRAKPCCSRRTRTCATANTATSGSWAALLRALDRPADALPSYEAAVATLDTTTIAAATSRRGFRRDVLPLYEEYADLMLAQTTRPQRRRGKRRAAHRAAQSRAAAHRRGTQLLRESVLRPDRVRPPARRRTRARDLSDAVRRSLGAAREQRR